VGRYQRNKGKRWEQDVARAYRDALPELADRVVRCDQSAGGDRGADVDVGGILWHECKVGARPNPLGAWEQVTERRGTNPAMRLVVAKKDRCEPTVTISFKAWLRIFKTLHTILGENNVTKLLQEADEKK
jgi:hypothetical protein